MTECYACGIKFQVKFDDDDSTLNFCPHCGQETVDEIQFNDDADNLMDLLDEEWDVDNY